MEPTAKVINATRKVGNFQGKVVGFYFGGLVGTLVLGRVRSVQNRFGSGRVVLDEGARTLTHQWFPATLRLYIYFVFNGC